MNPSGQRAVVIVGLMLGWGCGDNSETSTSGGTSSSATSSAASSGSGSSIDTCSGLDPSCSAGKYCDFPVCGWAVETFPEFEADCKELPATCPPGGRPVCACDGQAYPNADCALLATNLDRCYDEGRCRLDDTVYLVDCPAPAGYFACRNIFCNVATEYCAFSTCLLTWEQSECLPLPLTCATTPTCDCLLDATQATECTGSASEGFTVTESMGPDGC